MFSILKVIRSIYLASILLVSLLIIDGAKAESTSKLPILNKRIKEVEQGLSVHHQQQNQLENQLRDSELAIGSISTRLMQTQQQLKIQQSELNTLQQQQQRDQQHLLQQQQALAQELRSAYFLHRQGYLQLLLNEQDPARWSRLSHYLDYLNRHRVSLIADLKTNLQQINQRKIHILELTQSLQTLINQTQQQREQLLVQQQNRQHILEQVNNQIRQQQQQLQYILSQKQKLEQWINHLQILSASRASNQNNQNNQNVRQNTHFASLRGQLPWPTNGQILPLFGKAIENSQLRWNGIIIKANNGEPVRAVADGKVLFANWLAGLGLLIIIDHGDGYMSLYGHNNSLLKQAGEAVRSGEQIATVGNSGGYQESGLYFSIRYNGQPINPVMWCKSYRF